MKSNLQNEDVKVDAANHQPQDVVPQKAKTTQAKAVSTSALPISQTKPGETPSDARFSFGSATINITTPSITIAPSSISDGAADDMKREKCRENICTSFDKYEEQQEKLIAASYEKADGLLLTISSGILALSATFVGTLLNNKHSLKDLWELRLGWGSLGLTVVCVLVSYFASRKSLFYSVEAARANKDSLLSDDSNQETLTKSSGPCSRKREAFRKWTEVFNLSATFTFVCGLALIVMFAVMNIR